METRRKMQKNQLLEEKEFRLNSTPDWASLPEGILYEISKSLPLIDCISFADVCKRWRSILPEFPARQIRGLPWIMMFRRNRREVWSGDSIVENIDWDFEMSEACWWYCWGSFQDWLIMAKHIKKPVGQSFLKLMLFNPFSKAMIDLPYAAEFYHKMVLSANPSSGKKCICMLVHKDKSEVAFGIRGAQEWHELVIDGGPFDDAVFCGNCFYLVTRNYSIVKIEAASISSYNNINASAVSEIKVDYCEVNMMERPRMGRALRYLVESCGEILLVCRFFSVDHNALLQTDDFEIYRLDAFKMRWDQLKTLGDRILILGNGCSWSFLAKEIGIKKMNCIYFLKDRGVPWTNEWDIVQLREKFGKPFLKDSDKSDWGIFSLGVEDNQGFNYNSSVKHWAPICITAPLWWYCRPSINV